MEVKYVYKPVVIETAEQAADLPYATVAVLDDGVTVYSAVKRRDAGGYWLAGDDSEDDAGMIGWTALVKVEVKEETSVSAPSRRPVPFEEITFSLGGTSITDVHGRDITAEYTDWMASLPRKTRFCSEWV